MRGEKKQRDDVRWGEARGKERIGSADGQTKQHTVASFRRCGGQSPTIMVSPLAPSWVYAFMLSRSTTPSSLNSRPMGI
jgi:hypothetical protein